MNISSRFQTALAYSYGKKVPFAGSEESHITSNVRPIDELKLEARAGTELASSVHETILSAANGHTKNKLCDILVSYYNKVGMQDKASRIENMKTFM